MYINYSKKYLRIVGHHLRLLLLLVVVMMTYWSIMLRIVTALGVGGVRHVMVREVLTLAGSVHVVLSVTHVAAPGLL